MEDMTMIRPAIGDKEIREAAQTLNRYKQGKAKEDITMTIKLNNGTELEAILVTGATRYIQGANRDTLSFVFPAAAGLAELDGAFTPENCESITIVTEDGSENVHTGYTIRSELSKAAVEVEPATAESEAVYEDRITVVMAQRTYAETKLAQLQAAVAALTVEQ